MDGKNVTINISTGTVLKILGIMLLFLFAYIIRDILLMVFIAIIFAALVEPVVNFLESKKIPRGVGVIMIYIGLLLFIYLIVSLLIPPIVEQVSLLTSNFPGLWQQVVENYASVQQYSEEQGLYSNIQKTLEGLQSGLQQAATGAYAFIIALFQNVVNFLMVLVITFYLVVEKDSVHRLFRAVAPARYHEHLIQLFHDIQKKIGDWARGQLILGLIIGALSFVGLLILLPKYALVLALVAGITELIPYIGPILGAIPAVFLGFTMPPFSVGRGLAVLVLYVVIQQLENNVIVPKVMQKTLGLNPVVIIIVMLVGARLAGIIGMIIAIPVATTISVLVKDFLSTSGISKMKNQLDQEDLTG